MTKIWNESGFVTGDPWIIETEDRKAGPDEKAILSLDAFLEKAAGTNETGLGVLVNPADDVRRLEGHLDRLALVAVAFPAFNDGRAFSHASLLRSRLKFSGEVREPIVGRATKLQTLIELTESFDLDGIDTLVTGDGANDLGMIQNAGLGVAYHAKPAVAAAAAARIDHGDLTALLYAQGYHRDEFVEG